MSKVNFLSNIIETEKSFSVLWTVKVNTNSPIDLYIKRSSPLFSRSKEDIQWRLRLYIFKREKNGASGDSCLYCQVKNANRKIKALYTVNFLNLENEVEFRQKGSAFFPTNFNITKIASNFLDNLKPLVTSDEVKLRIQFIIENECFSEGPDKIIAKGGKDGCETCGIVGSLTNDLDALLTTQKFSDFVIMIGNQEIAVHKNILASRSSKFRDILEKDFKLAYLEISDVDKDATVSMIRFLYTCKVTISSMNEAQMLFIAADQYDVLDLKGVCENYLLKNINPSNVVDVIIFGDRHNVAELKGRAMDYAVKNFQIMPSSQLDVFKESDPCLIVSMLKNLKNSFKSHYE